MSNFRRIFNISLINGEVNLTLTWSKNCIKTDSCVKTRVAVAVGNSPVISEPTDAAFSVTDAKLYVSFVTLSPEDDNKLLQHLKTGFKGTLRENKYRSEMSNNSKINNLNYLIDPMFYIFNILFVLSLESKVIEWLSQNFMYQLLKSRTFTCWLTVNVFLSFL